VPLEQQARPDRRGCSAFRAPRVRRAFQVIPACKVSRERPVPTACKARPVRPARRDRKASQEMPVLAVQLVRRGPTDRLVLRVQRAGPALPESLEGRVQPGQQEQLA
jgi:hypothetical protein